MEEFDSTAKDLASSEGGEHWLLRPSGSLLFFISSILVFATWMFAYSLYFFHRVGWLAYPNNSEWFVGICIGVAFLAIPSSLYLLVGMLWYWVKFDESRRLAKAVWLLSFLVLAWLAAAAYCLTVYRKQVPLKNRGSKAL